jgi:hypothetical protein
MSHVDVRILIQELVRQLWKMTGLSMLSRRLSAFIQSQSSLKRPIKAHLGQIKDRVESPPLLVRGE